MDHAPREDADVETSSDAYARRFEGALGDFFLEVQATATLALLAPFPGARVVEVGGGHGQLTGPLLAAGHAVTVVGSTAACAHRVRGHLEAGRAGFAVGDLLRLPLGDRGVEVALAFRLLPHVRALSTLVGELCRVSARAVIVDYPTRRSVNAVQGAFFALKKGIEKDTRPFRVFRDAEVADAFRAAGFEIAERRSQFVAPMALHRAHGSARLARGLETGARVLGLRALLGSPVVVRAERRG
jgi:hypothetical protein